MAEKRPRIRPDLAARIDYIRGDVPFERYVQRLIEYALLDRFEPVAVATNDEVDEAQMRRLRSATYERQDA